MEHLDLQFLSEEVKQIMDLLRVRPRTYRVDKELVVSWDGGEQIQCLYPALHVCGTSQEVIHNVKRFLLMWRCGEIVAFTNPKVIVDMLTYEVSLHISFAAYACESEIFDVEIH